MRREQPRWTRSDATHCFAYCALFVLVASLPLQSPAVAQEVAAARPVAETERFAFYSRFLLNLHDRLRHEALVGEADTSECLQGLPQQDRDGWERAVRQYQAVLHPQAARRNALLIRAHLAGFGKQAEAVLGPMPEQARQALKSATAAYQTCGWAKDDEANRQWIEALRATLLEAGEEVASRLAQAYQTPWGTPRIPVDVVPFVSRQGASTIQPGHILINSSRESYQGRAALEMVFHEASHTILGPDRGEPSKQLEQAAQRLGFEVPADLWHVVLFYTAGEVVRKVRKAIYGEEYVPYAYATGLLRRAWPEFQEPLETWWKPYLDGRLTMAEAAEGVLRALNP